MSISLTAVENKIFREDKDGVVSIGGIKIDQATRGVLRDEAAYIQRSNFWEIFNATIKNEAATMALITSMNWDHTLSAKQLYYWQQAMEKIMKKLAQ